MPLPYRILVADDEEVIRDVIPQLLVSAGYQVITASNGEEALEQMEEQAVDLVLLDLMMPGMGGLVSLEKILEMDPEAIVVMITAYASVETAVRAIKMGAFGFVTKPFQNEELLVVIKNGLEKRRLKNENLQLREKLKKQFIFEKIVGRSQPMQEVFELITLVAPRRSTVLIQGESGTGKELVAKAIHNQSPRSKASFVPVNTGSIPSDLLESELFGHIKGAFTGATANKKGLFELADTGTIFLDEVGTITPETQSKLLRVIQEREFRRVGGLDNIRVDVRIIAATNSDLKRAVQERRFRDDLYYRLNVITLHLPPLRERKEDIPLLTDHFTRKFGREHDRGMFTWDEEVMGLLMGYDWPGNVRELENAIERAIVLAPESNRISQQLLPPDVLTSGTLGPQSINLGNNGRLLKDRVLEFEKSLISSALKETDGNQKKAAHILGVNPTTLSEKLKRLKLKGSRKRSRRSRVSRARRVHPPD